MIEIIRNEEKKANEILKEYVNADLRVWSYSPTFNIVELMVGLNHNKMILFITFSNCLYIRGKLSLFKTSLRIIEHNGITEIIDSNSDFMVKGESGFILKKGLVTDFFDPPNDLPKFPWEEEGNGE